MFFQELIFVSYSLKSAKLIPSIPVVPCFWDFQFLYRNTVQETWGIEGAVKLHGDGQLPQNLLSLAVDISP
jgi:hypothetical protein